MVFVLCLVAGFVIGAEPVPAQTNHILLDGVAARVNGKAVTVGDVMMFVAPVRRQLARTYAGDELHQRLRKAFSEALTALVERRLILDAYAAQEMKMPEWVVDQRVAEIVHEEFDGDRAALMRALAQDRITFDQWRSEVRDQLIVTSMRQSYVADMVSLPPMAVREYYDANREKFLAPAQIHLRVLELHRGDTPDAMAAQRRQAEALLARIKAGEDFAAVARQRSEGSRAVDGGDMGWLDPAMCRRELVAAVEPLKVGECSGVIETRDGWYLVKLEGRKEAAPKEFESVRADVERDLRNQESERLYQSWVAGLRREASVELLDVEL